MEPSPARLELANLPTPIERCERLTRELGVRLFVKRDDLTGSTSAATRSASSSCFWERRFAARRARS